MTANGNSLETSYRIQAYEDGFKPRGREKSRDLRDS